jgi:predicted TIM-barrel fold metal-dependent hydrolase
MKAAQKMIPLDDLELFDTCCTLGSGVFTGVSEWITPENVIAILDRYHIKEALVHDHHARLIYPREHGNTRLLETVKNIERLHPVWVIDPPKQPGKGPAENLVGSMLDAGVKAVRFRMYTIPPCAWIWKDLCTALEKHSLPCFLDFGDVSTRGDVSDTDVTGIREICLGHPGLPFVLSHVMGGLGVHPAIMYLIRRVPNLYIDITGILEYWRETAKEAGPERVLFATGMPFTEPAILISNIQYAVGFTDEEKKLMAGGNMRRLLGDTA